MNMNTKENVVCDKEKRYFKYLQERIKPIGGMCTAISVLLNFALIALFIFIYFKLGMGSIAAGFCGIWTFFIIGTCLQALVLKNHNTGMMLAKQQQFSTAILFFEKNLDFFTRNKWVDKFRFLTFLNASEVPSKAIELCNIAFCYSQTDNVDKAKEYYERTLNEFPDNGVALTSLRFINSLEQTTNRGNESEEIFQNKGIDAALLNILTENLASLELDQSVKFYLEKTGHSLSATKKYINALWHSHYQKASQQLRFYLQKSYWKNYSYFFGIPILGWLTVLMLLIFPRLKNVDIKKQSNIFSPFAQKYFSNYGKIQNNKKNAQQRTDKFSLCAQHKQ